MPCVQQRAHTQGIYKEVPQVRRDGEGEGETEIETYRERRQSMGEKRAKASYKRGYTSDQNIGKVLNFTDHQGKAN